MTPFLSGRRSHLPWAGTSSLIKRAEDILAPRSRPRIRDDEAAFKIENIEASAGAAQRAGRAAGMWSLAFRPTVPQPDDAA